MKPYLILLITIALPVVVCAGGDDDFAWSWEGGKGDAKGKGVPPAEYEKLLQENIKLRRQAEAATEGVEDAQRKETARAKEVEDLEGKIAELAARLTKAKGADGGDVDPDQIVAMEAQLAAVESEKARLATELEQLRAGGAATSKAAIKPGSALYTDVERENAEMRAQLAEIKAEKERASAELDSNRADLEELQARETVDSGRREAVVGHLQRIPELEGAVVRLSQELRAGQQKLALREDQLRTLALELKRREHRVGKAERMAVLLTKTGEEVQQVTALESRDLHYNMAVVYSDREQYEDAEREYLNALRVDATDADSHYNLGILYEQALNKPKKALRHYRRFLKLSPESPEAPEVKSWIVELEVE